MSSQLDNLASVGRDYSRLRRWYLARLRKSAIAKQSDLTPAALIAADREFAQKLALEHAPTPAITVPEIPVTVVQAASIKGYLVGAWVLIIICTFGIILYQTNMSFPQAMTSFVDVLWFRPNKVPWFARAGVFLTFIWPYLLVVPLLFSPAKRPMPSALDGWFRDLRAVFVTIFTVFAVQSAVLLPGLMATHPAVRSIFTVALVLCLCNMVLLILAARFAILGPLRTITQDVRASIIGATHRRRSAARSEIEVLGMLAETVGSELNEALTREQAIADYSEEFFWSLDEELVVRAMSIRGYSFLNIKPADLIGHKLDKLVSAESLSEFLVNLESAKTKKMPVEFETRMRKGDGTLADAALSLEWSQTDSFFYIVGWDITEQKEIQRIKQEFIAILSHDLRSPLSSLQCCLELLDSAKCGELNADGHQILESGHKSVTRLIDLINDLLDLEKMEAGRLELKRERFHAEDVLEAAYDALLGLAGQSEVKLKLDPIDEFLYADHNRVLQVILNLVSNAIRHSEAGQTVTLGCKRVDEDTIEITVSDTAGGIAPEMREKVFDRYQQGTSGKRGSSGLGLAICKAIVLAHGGQIGVESEVGVGSTFWFRLPKSAPQTSPVLAPGRQMG